MNDGIMDLLSSMREYFAELDETQRSLNMHCRRIQLALRALHNRRHIEELLMQEVEEQDEISGISDMQMAEIDILIKKAEKVLVDDTCSNDRKKKSTPVDGKHTIAPARLPSSKLQYTKRKCSQLSKKTVNRNTPKPKRNGFTEKKGVVDEQKAGRIKLNEEVAQVNEIGKKKCESLSTLYDTMFKEEYCKMRKLKGNLLKLKDNQSLVETNNESICEFMTSMKRGNDVDTKLDINEIKLLSASNFTKKEMTEIVVNIDNIKKVGYDVIHEYAKCNPLYPYKDVASSNNFYDINTSSTKELQEFNKLMQVKYNFNFQQKLKQSVENHIPSGGIADQNISYYRQLYLLLLDSDSFPSLVRNE